MECDISPTKEFPGKKICVLNTVYSLIEFETWSVVICFTDKFVRVPFHKHFFPSGEQLEHHKLAHELLQPTASCIEIFYKYCCYTKCGGITNFTLRNHWGTLPMCRNTTMQVNEAWIKKCCMLCSKTYNTLHSCHNFPADLRQATRGTRICEMSLLHYLEANKCP